MHPHNRKKLMETKTKSALLIKPDGTEIQLTPANGKHFSLEECQTIVGGSISLTECGSDKWLLVNDNGLEENLPINPKASAVYAAMVAHATGRAPGTLFPIVGTVLICDKDQME